MYFTQLYILLTNSLLHLDLFNAVAVTDVSMLKTMVIVHVHVKGEVNLD